METPKTKSFVAMAEALNLAGKKVLLVVAETDHNICLSVRNLPKVKVMQADSLNTYDVMNAGVMLFTESALAKVNENF